MKAARCFVRCSMNGDGATRWCGWRLWVCLAARGLPPDMVALVWWPCNGTLWWQNLNSAPLRSLN